MKYYRLIPVLTVLLCLSALNVVGAQDTERILSYDSDIAVHQDGSMTVTETIKVVANGDKIKRGIYREFPTIYTSKYGKRVVVRFDVKQVTRNGEREPYKVKNASNGKRIYLGGPDAYLDPRTYTYAITYDTTRQLGFFKDHDELYWNVTGTGWDFAIDKVTAVVTLPKRVNGSDLRLAGYTGVKGSKDQDYEANVDSRGRAVFTTTSPLNPREGLTIVVGWPKGILTPPSEAQQQGWFLQDNLGAVLGLLGLVIVIAYYIRTWNKVGRDPRKGTIIPIYEPPDGLSPAALRYICRMGYDNKALAAALINMGVKRYVKISEEKKVYTISRYKGDPSTLSREEQQLAERLLSKDGSIELKDTNHSRIQKAIDAMKLALDEDYGEGYFSRNGVHMIPGVLLSVVAAVASAISMPGGLAGEAIGAAIWLGVWTAGVAMLLSAVIAAWRKFARVGGSSCMSAGCLTLFAIPFVVAEILGPFIVGENLSPVLVALAMALVAVNLLFMVLLRAPTQKGRELLDKIEGFRLYMSVADKDELNTMNPPERTPEVFERNLPYALALDVEQQWSEKFAEVLEKAIEVGEYEPDWYTGTAFGRGFTGAALTSVSTAMGSSLAGAIASSSTAPGSSSGFSGGGSSGGGGGGGGGGGW